MTAPAVLERPPETIDEPADGSRTAEPCVIQEWGRLRLIESHLIEKFLEVCQKTAIRSTKFIYCPYICTGHQICQACYMLGIKEGVIK